uniref:Protein rolling stone n=1 Tax=Ciona intestinalis TaxID=7719 RepID=F6XPY9_CIOIN
MCRLLKNELKIRRFGFEGFEATDFQTSKLPPKLFIVYRVIIFVYWTSMLGERFAAHDDKIRFFFYLSYWNQIMVGIYFGFACFSAVHGRMNIKQRSSSSHVMDASSESKNLSDTSPDRPDVTDTSSETDKCNPGNDVTTITISDDDVTSKHCLSSTAPLRWFHVTTAIFQVMSFSVAIFVSVIYATTEWKSKRATLDFSFQNLNLHFANTLLMFCDVIITNIPTRLLHFIYVCLFTLIYDLYLMTLHFTGAESALYKIVNWNNDVTWVVCFYIVMIFIVSPFTHSIMFLVFTIKRSVTSYCRRL